MTSVSGATATRTVRFSHVDAAGIVFYPRYVELVAAAFPEAALFTPPFAADFEFVAANRLGDALDFELSDAGSSRTLRGNAAGSECLRIDWHRNVDVSAPNGHPFMSPRVTVEAWAAGPDGSLHASRYFECINTAVEHWFADDLDWPFARLHTEQHRGVPTVRLGSRCRRLPAVGEAVSLAIRPLAIGRTSMTCRSWLMAGDDCLATTDQVLVHVRHTDGGLSPEPWPSAARSRLEARLAVPEDG